MLVRQARPWRGVLDCWGRASPVPNLLTRMAYVERVLEGLRYVFTSPNEADSNLETANIVDGLYRLARAIDRLAVEVSKTGVSGC